MSEAIIDRKTRGGENRREVSGNELAQKRKTEITRTGEHTFRVPSRTVERRVYTVDIEHNFCTCKDAQINGQICAHLFAAAAVMMELNQEPEYVIVKKHNSRIPGYEYRLIEYRDGLEVGLVGVRDSWFDCYLDRVDLERRIA